MERRLRAAASSGIPARADSISVIAPGKRGVPAAPSQSFTEP
jgi:hypothetical protein